nr:MAG TPA: hypothetical protein [Caudoviricetes sp.]
MFLIRYLVRELKLILIKSCFITGENLEKPLTWMGKISLNRMVLLNYCL